MNSTNIKVMSEEIQHLKDEVHNLDVEIPSHDSGDAGKYLGVDASGDLEFSNVPSDLPVTTEAATGDVLGLTGEEKIPGWITPFTPFSFSTQEINTGFKWVDGKDIYCKSATGTCPDSGYTLTMLSLTDFSNVDSIINIFFSVHDTTNTRYNFYSPAPFLTDTGYLNLSLSASIFGQKYNTAIFYTRNEPTRDDDTNEEQEVKKNTRKKSTK